MPFDAHRRGLERASAGDPASRSRLVAAARRAGLPATLGPILQRPLTRGDLREWVEELAPFGAWVVVEVLAVGVELALAQAQADDCTTVAALARRLAAGTGSPAEARALLPVLERAVEVEDVDASAAHAAAHRLLQIALGLESVSLKSLVQQATLALRDVTSVVGIGSVQSAACVSLNPR